MKNFQGFFGKSASCSKTVFTLAAALCASVSHAAVLFDNGPVVDGSGLSILTPPASTLGAGSNAGATLADNFTVGGSGWNVASLDFFGYQTQNPGPGVYTFTNVTWSIVAGANVNTGSVVASGTTAVTNGGFVGYRVTSTTLGNQSRAIFRISADITDVDLAAGSYFLTWALAGTGASGPFVPPVLGSLGSGNALQSLSGGAYAPLQDAGTLESFDVPFTINGTRLGNGAVPEPATWMMMIGGFGMIGFGMRRRQTSTNALPA